MEGQVLRHAFLTSSQENGYIGVCHAYKEPKSLLVLKNDVSAVFLNNILDMVTGLRIARTLATGTDVMHCLEISTVGASTWFAHKRLRIPYIVYVSTADLDTSVDVPGNAKLRRILGDSGGIVVESLSVKDHLSDIMKRLKVSEPPPVALIPPGQYITLDENRSQDNSAWEEAAHQAAQFVRYSVAGK